MNRDLIFVALALATWGIGEGAFLAFQPLYLQKLGADPLRIGAILSGYGIATALAHIPAGFVADRWGRKPVMVAAWLLGLFATAVMALATALPLLVTGILIYGLTMFVLSPMYSYVTSASGKWSAARAITFTTASYYLGAFFGPVLGGVLGDRFGFRTIYFAAAGIFVLSTILMLLIHSQPVETVEPGSRQRQRLDSPAFIQFLGIFFLAVFAMFLAQPLSPNYLQNERGLGLTQIGSLYSAAGLGIVVISLVLGRLETRLGFVLGQGLVLSFPLLLWLANGLPGYALAYFLLGGFRATRSLANAQTRALVHPAKMGVAFGLTETVGALATILAPLLAGYLYSREPVWVYAAGAVLITVSILASLFFFWARAAAPVEESSAPSAREIPS